jgi:hypothetical protein
MSRTIRTPGAAAAAAEIPAEVPAVVADEGLPNAIDVDVRAITAPVLTRQGWLCPAASPQPLLR